VFSSHLTVTAYPVLALDFITVLAPSTRVDRGCSTTKAPEKGADVIMELSASREISLGQSMPYTSAGKARVVV
jgi:hypothetical protein